MQPFSRTRFLAAGAATAALAACGRRPGADAVKVGSKNFTEELILGELYAQSLEHAGLSVTRRLDLGTTDIAMAALHRGEIDLYPEYTGTALVNVLHLPPDSDPKRSYDTVAKMYRDKYDLVWLAAAPLNDTQGLATTHAVAAQNGDMRTLSELAGKAAGLRLGAVTEFLSRADGLPGLQKAYGGFHFKDVKIIDNGVKYQALLRGDVDVVLAFTTEGQLKADDLVLFADDKHLFPVDQVAPVVRKAALDARPALREPLDKLSPLLTDDAMQSLNLLVDGPQKQEPADVARDFLKAHDLV